jgi:NADH-quinone oxidoreductase subunit L
LSGSWGGNLLTDFLQGSPALAAGAIAATKGPAEFHLVVAGTSTAAALAGIVLALYLYLGDAREASFLQRLFNLEGADRLTDPQWVVNLERVGWIGETTRDLRGIHLGWLVALVGYLLGAISLVLAIPLLVGQFISPYKLSKNKFYFDELYAALIVWPLSVLASICYWIDRWIVDGLVNATGWVPAVIGSLMRSLQMGLVQFYALAMVLGALVLVAARLIWAAG